MTPPVSVSVDARPWTDNAARRIRSRHQVAQMVRDTRRMWQLAAQAAGVTAQATPVAVTVRVEHKRGPLQDTGACSLYTKAAIDGLRDAGVLSDDTGNEIASITYIAPVKTGADRVTIEIEGAS